MPLSRWDPDIRTATEQHPGKRSKLREANTQPDDEQNTAQKLSPFEHGSHHPLIPLLEYNSEGESKSSITHLRQYTHRRYSPQQRTEKQLP